MVCCCAVGCSNSNRKGFRLFLIPREIKRRELWLAKIRRDKWTPTSGSRLCEAHFEESAFEQNRIDGWKKLKQTAIPTIFPTVEVVQRHLNGKVQIKEEAPKGARTPEPSAPNFLEEKNQCATVADENSGHTSILPLCVYADKFIRSVGRCPGEFGTLGRHSTQGDSYASDTVPTLWCLVSPATSTKV
uniref:THAP-type domain-containing protein n=1 Tax=Ixodes ricinus TaxID=34613 RepID=A0A090XBM7_IXORI